MKRPRDARGRRERHAKGERGAPARRGPPERIHPRKSLVRVLSRAGHCSRKEAERLVAERRVTVNGRLARDPEKRIDEARDAVAVDGQRLQRAEALVVALHKPAGVVTTLRDEHGRRTVYDLLAELPSWVAPVGRLDRDSTGLLLLTNDTKLADRLTDPRRHVPKVYRALCRGPLSPARLDELRQGIDLEDGRTRPATVRVLEERPDGTLLEMILTEGRNRQVRRMLEAVHSKVLALHRLAVGPVGLGALPEGGWRALQPAEVAALRRGALAPAD